jgi:hypothetical protein
MEKGPNYYEGEKQPNFRPEYVESMRRRDVMDDLIDLKRGLTLRDPLGYYNKEFALAQKIKEAYPDDYHTYQMWNLLVHGTIEPDRQPNFDFTGELSVEQFIRNQAEANEPGKQQSDDREAA